MRGRFRLLAWNRLARNSGFRRSLSSQALCRFFTLRSILRSLRISAASPEFAASVCFGHRSVRSRHVFPLQSAFSKRFIRSSTNGNKDGSKAPFSAYSGTAFASCLFAVELLAFSRSRKKREFTSQGTNDAVRNLCRERGSVHRVLWSERCVLHVLRLKRERSAGGRTRTSRQLRCASRELLLRP
jgi:hypothetical protein